jgi:hypothetical protein
MKILFYIDNASYGDCAVIKLIRNHQVAFGSDDAVTQLNPAYHEVVNKYYVARDLVTCHRRKPELIVCMGWSDIS